MIPPWVVQAVAPIAWAGLGALLLCHGWAGRRKAASAVAAACRSVGAAVLALRTPGHGRHRAVPAWAQHMTRHAVFADADTVPIRRVS